MDVHVAAEPAIGCGVDSSLRRQPDVGATTRVDSHRRPRSLELEAGTCRDSQRCASWNSQPRPSGVEVGSVVVVPLLQRTLGEPSVVLLVDDGPADHSIARNRQLARGHDGQQAIDIDRLAIDSQRTVRVASGEPQLGNCCAPGRNLVSEAVGADDRRQRSAASR